MDVSIGLMRVNSLSPSILKWRLCSVAFYSSFRRRPHGCYDNKRA
jgi:hypothetical protein